jgi:hypothetical protein
MAFIGITPLPQTELLHLRKQSPLIIYASQAGVAVEHNTHRVQVQVDFVQP